MSGNEPAFPSATDGICAECGNYNQVSKGGLTKREWYAGMALQGLMLRWKENGYDRAGAVNEAYRYANAMIAQGEKANDKP